MFHAAETQPLWQPDSLRGTAAWTPLLSGDAAARALAAVLPIDNWVAGPAIAAPHSPLLADGDAGFAVFHSYAALSLGKEPRIQRALDSLTQAVSAVESMHLNPGLASGFTGIAWATEHVGRMLASAPALESSPSAPETDAADADDDVNVEIDRALLDFTARSSWRKYDLFDGLAGLGIYALQRLPDRSAIRLLTQVVRRLDELATHSGNLVWWYTQPADVPRGLEEQYPKGFANFGLAHGVPGVLTFLAHAHRAAVDAERTERLIDGAVRWILSYALPDGDRGRFPTVIDHRSTPSPARLAWCYGDPGVAVSLLAAARATGNHAWAREAVATARHAAARSFEDSRVVDAGICHGSAGVAHIFNRLYQSTGELRLRDAAIEWIDRTMQFQQRDQGAGGFASYVPAGLTQGEPAKWVDDAALLTGAAGVALVLLAASTDVEPAWDRFCLLSPVAPRVDNAAIHAPPSL